MPACPHCGFQVRAGGAECPLCGSRLTSTPPAAGGTETTPWEDPDAAFPVNLIQTWRQSVFAPAAFFRRMPVEAPLARPLLYYLIISVLTAFFVLIWRSVGSSVLPVGLLGWNDPLMPLIEFFLEPFLAMIGLAIGSLVLHLLVLLFADRRKGIGTTARVFCYSWGPGVFALFPVLGPPVGFVWSVVLMVIGVREAHETTSGRAAAIVLTPLIALFLLLVFLATLLVMLGLTGEVLDW